MICPFTETNYQHLTDRSIELVKTVITLCMRRMLARNKKDAFHWRGFVVQEFGHADV